MGLSLTDPITIDPHFRSGTSKCFPEETPGEIHPGKNLVVPTVKRQGGEKDKKSNSQAVKWKRAMATHGVFLVGSNLVCSLS